MENAVEASAVWGRASRPDLAVACLPPRVGVYGAEKQDRGPWRGSNRAAVATRGDATAGDPPVRGLGLATAKKQDRARTSLGRGHRSDRAREFGLAGNTSAAPERRWRERHRLSGSEGRHGRCWVQPRVA
tara:strand:+ start:3164 stop:3553 length:390 start_codon:yes stop_codon:yes gene_type:complete